MESLGGVLDVQTFLVRPEGHFVRTASLNEEAKSIQLAAVRETDGVRELAPVGVTGACWNSVFSSNTNLNAYARDSLKGVRTGLSDLT